MKSKQFWIDLGEVIDTLRIIPRLMLVAVSCFVLWFSYYVTHFYFVHLDMLSASSPAIYGASGVISITVPAVMKFGIDYVNRYLTSGRDWKTKKEVGTEAVEK